MTRTLTILVAAAALAVSAAPTWAGASEARRAATVRTPTQWLVLYDGHAGLGANIKPGR